MGREFIDLFDQWAATYDDTVRGSDEEYKEVFKNYSGILMAVSQKVSGNVLEFGVGTGNLTKFLQQTADHIYGIEPSPKMRKIAQLRFPLIPILDGDFLNFPPLPGPIDSIVSTYAFHHVTDQEKGEAIQKYSSLLPRNGRIVFADTVFENEQSRSSLLKRAEQRGYHNLLHDLQIEHYTTIDVLNELFEKNSFRVTFTQENQFVWLMDAIKN